MSMLSVPTAKLATARRSGQASIRSRSIASVSIERIPSAPAASCAELRRDGGNAPRQTSTSWALRSRSRASKGSLRVTMQRAIAPNHAAGEPRALRPRLASRRSFARHRKQLRGGCSPSPGAGTGALGRRRHPRLGAGAAPDASRDRGGAEARRRADRLRQRVDRRDARRRRRARTRRPRRRPR